MATLVVGPSRAQGRQTWPALIKWTAYALTVSVLCAYVAGVMEPLVYRTVDDYEGRTTTVFHTTGAVAFLGYAFSRVYEWAWKGLGTSVMLRFAIDGAIYALITASTLAGLWPAGPFIIIVF